MVVVAIIGILAVIGIPQYQKFMSKARQAEAKSHLNAIFQGESSYFTEYNHYTQNVKAIGGGAVGQNLRYNAGFRVTDCGSQPTGTGAPPWGTAAENDIIAIVNAGTPITATWTYAGSVSDPAAIGTCTAGGAGFSAGAWGNPTNTANATNNADQFTITETRLLTQTAVGL